MIIDTHVYVWDERSDPRAMTHELPHWVTPPFRTRTRSVRLDEVDSDMTASGVTGVVVVQATNTLRHTDELLAAAADSPRPTKVVGWLPLTDPGYLASTLRYYRDEHALAGVRHRLMPGEDPGMLGTAAAAESLELVADAGMALDVLPWPPIALEHVPAIAQQHPHLTIVVDLLGWPQISTGRMQPWTDHLAAAAGCPKVHVKVGGLHRMTGTGADPAAWQPYVATAVELFGPDRIMIGSDWPAVMVSGLGYTDGINATLAAFKDVTPAEMLSVQYETAARVYGFGPPGETPPAATPPGESSPTLPAQAAGPQLATPRPDTPPDEHPQTGTGRLGPRPGESELGGAPDARSRPHPVT